MIRESAPALVADKRLVLGVTSGPFGTKVRVRRDSIYQRCAESDKHHDGITDRSGVDFVDGMRNEVAWKNVETICFRVVRGGCMRLGLVVRFTAYGSKMSVVRVRQPEVTTNFPC